VAKAFAYGLEDPAIKIQLLLRGEKTWKQTVGVATSQEMNEGRQRRADALRPSHHALTVIMENADPSLVTQGWVGDKPCLGTVDTGAYIIVARPDISEGWPERQPNQ
jgi:hypothetical protein